MKKQIITLTVAALTLSSCGIYTQYKPATEVPDNLYGEEVAVADTVDNIGNLSWQEIFTDPRLQELIEQGLRNEYGFAVSTMACERGGSCYAVSQIGLSAFFRSVTSGDSK